VLAGERDITSQKTIQHHSLCREMHMPGLNSKQGKAISLFIAPKIRIGIQVFVILAVLFNAFVPTIALAQPVVVKRYDKRLSTKVEHKYQSPIFQHSKPRIGSGVAIDTNKSVALSGDPNVYFNCLSVRYMGGPYRSPCSSNIYGQYAPDWHSITEARFYTTPYAGNPSWYEMQLNCSGDNCEQERKIYYHVTVRIVWQGWYVSTAYRNASLSRNGYGNGETTETITCGSGLSGECTLEINQQFQI
jgi:hypothetical protein